MSPWHREQLRMIWLRRVCAGTIWHGCGMVRGAALRTIAAELNCCYPSNE